MKTLAWRAFALAAGAPLLLAQSNQPGAPVPGAAPPRNANARELPIDWSKAQADRRVTLQRGEAPRLQRVTPQQLDASHLPVLLPNTGEMRASGLVFPSPHSYAATVNLPDATVEVFGSSRAAPLAPAMEKDLKGHMKPTASGYLVSDTEYGQEISLNRYGIAYSVMITCKAPRTDDRCTKPEFLTTLADQMVMFGGTPEASP